MVVLLQDVDEFFWGHGLSACINHAAPIPQN